MALGLQGSLSVRPSPPPYKPNPKVPRHVLPVLFPEVRAKTAQEVALGFEPAAACEEAQRCMQCEKPACVDACPLHINIKAFIGRLAMGDAAGAKDVISQQ